MGNCCGSKSINHHGVREYNDGKYKLPKFIVTSQDSALIYLDISSSKASKRLRNSLKRKFPNLVWCDGENRILKQIEMMKERKYYIIVGGNIREETLRSLLTSSKVKAIYFCLKEINLGHHSKSSKIKGFFTNQMELKQAIYYDIRLDESY